MKLATFIGPDGEARAGEVLGDEVRAFVAGLTVAGVLGGSEPRFLDGAWPLAEVELLAPVPEPGTVYGIGLNYAKHIEETGAQRPEFPIVFVKVLGSVAPPGGPIRCP